MLKLLRYRFWRFGREAVILWYAFRDPATPRGLKLASLAAALYLISPIDLIPVTIPFLGILDDLIIVPWATSLVAGRLPGPVRENAGGKADRWISRWLRRPLLALAVAVLALVAVWAGLLWFLYWLIWG